MLDYLNTLDYSALETIGYLVPFPTIQTPGASKYRLVSELQMQLILLKYLSR